MSKEEKKELAKAITNTIVAKAVKHVPAKHVPSAHVFLTRDVLMDNLRRNYIKKIAYPWDIGSFEAVTGSGSPHLVEPFLQKRRVEFQRD